MKTLMSETKWCRFEPSDDLLNPYLTIITHKKRPVLSELLEPNKIRRSLSALLNSKKTDPLIDNDPSFMNNLHNFESTHQQMVSNCAPNKDKRPFSSLRLGRDPRTKTRRPFLTYEGMPMTKAEQKKFELKQCHMKVMTERIQNYNKVNFVPKSKQTGTDAPLPPSSLNLEELAEFKKTAEFAGITAVEDPNTSADEAEPKMPSKIMENLYDSNVGDIIKCMSVHDQMKLIHNIMANEEFKKECRKKESEAKEQKKKAAEEAVKRIEQGLESECWGGECICSQGDAAELEKRQKEVKLSMETEEAEKENKVYKAVKVNEKPTMQKGVWQTAEEYIPESQRSKAEGKSKKSIDVSAKPSSKAPSEQDPDAKFYNRASLGNLDDAKELKVPALNFDGDAEQKDPKKEFTLGPLPSTSKELKKKEERTLKTGKWEKAEPFVKLSKEDRQKLEEFQELKRKRHERELEVVKKCANLTDAACSPSRGNHTHPDQQ